MTSAPSHWEDLFEEAASFARGSVTESREAVLRNARLRWGRDASDLAAVRVVAVAELQSGRAERCLELLEATESGLHVDALTNRIAAYACLARSRPLIAKRFFDRCVRLSPHQPDAWYWLGWIHQERGESDRAIAYYQRGTFFDDVRYQSTLALARLLDQVGGPAEAARSLADAIQRDQRSPRLHRARARYLRKLAGSAAGAGNWRRCRQWLQETRRSLRVVVAAMPTASSWLALASVENELENPEGARDAYAKAVQCDDRHPYAHAKLGVAALEDGETTKAEFHLKRAVELRPSCPIAHFHLSRIAETDPGTKPEATVSALRELTTSGDLPPGQQVSLLFALANRLEALGRFEEAWAAFDRANRLKPGHRDRYRGTALSLLMKRSVDDRLRVLTKAFFQERGDRGSQSEVPVFVVGMPRSGTTLVEQILASHRDVEGAGELKTIEQLRQQLGFDHRQSQGRSFAKEDVEVITELSAAALVGAAEEYLGILRRRGGEARRVVDKMPTNFLHLGLIALLFPKATVVHCRRDPMDVLASAYRQNLTAPFCDLETLADYYVQYRRLMEHWSRVLDIRIHAVDYESLVSQPETQMRGLVAACGLEWDARCLDFHQHARPVRTPSKCQVRRPLYRSSVGAWRRYERQFEPIRKRLEAGLAEITANRLGSETCAAAVRS